MTPTSGQPAHGAAERCSRQWWRDDLPAWGTASRADFWVGLEQPGPWGRKAITQSHLDPELGDRLEAVISQLGGRLVLIRRPGRHVDEGCSTPRMVLVGAGMTQGTPWVGQVRLLDPAHLLDLLAGFSPDHRPDWLEPCAPALLVCTNAKRDRCCALEGRELVTELHGGPVGNQVWEASHLGGHRFAPTAVVLPTNQMLARLDSDLSLAALDAAVSGRPLDCGAFHDRGLSHLPAEQQAVDAHARAAGVDRAGLRAETMTMPTQRASSCGAAAVPVTVWTVEEIDG